MLIVEMGDGSVHATAGLRPVLHALAGRLLSVGVSLTILVVLTLTDSSLAWLRIMAWVLFAAGALSFAWTIRSISRWGVTLTSSQLIIHDKQPSQWPWAKILGAEVTPHGAQLRTLHSHLDLPALKADRAQLVDLINEQLRLRA